MRWLTDSPESTQCFLPENMAWKQCDSNDGEALTSILAAFNPDKPAWIAESGNDGSPFPNRSFVLIDEAAESQFDQALGQLNKQHELPDGLVCIALTGSGFRGQRKRPWQAVRGNLHLTAHYRLDVLARDNQAALTMLPAIASAEAIGELLGDSLLPEIKWVNDVLLDGKKVSGVLTATNVSGETIDRAVFGIGVNVAQAPEIMPTPFVPKAGSLTGVSPDKTHALPELFTGIVKKLDELVLCLRENRQDELFRRYAGKVRFIGRDVRIWPEGTEDLKNSTPIAMGRVDQLNRDLSLTIDGVPEPIRSGRMAFEENC